MKMNELFFTNVLCIFIEEALFLCEELLRSYKKTHKINDF